MSNHFHLLLEVPPMPDGGSTDEELLKRRGAIYTEAFVATVAKELIEERKTENQRLVEEIHTRLTYRTHDLSEFMKTLLPRLCPRSTLAMRSGRASSGAPRIRHAATAASAFPLVQPIPPPQRTLWKKRYKSVIVEDGVTARTMAAGMELNPAGEGMAIGLITNRHCRT